MPNEETQVFGSPLGGKPLADCGGLRGVVLRHVFTRVKESPFMSQSDSLLGRLGSGPHGVYHVVLAMG